MVNNGSEYMMELFLDGRHSSADCLFLKDESEPVARTAVTLPDGTVKRLIFTHPRKIGGHECAHCSPGPTC